mgnify:CR=1 FL=1
MSEENTVLNLLGADQPGQMEMQKLNLDKQLLIF